MTLTRRSERLQQAEGEKHQRKTAVKRSLKEAVDRRDRQRGRQYVTEAVYASDSELEQAGLNSPSESSESEADSESHSADPPALPRRSGRSQPQAALRTPQRSRRRSQLPPAKQNGSARKSASKFVTGGTRRSATPEESAPGLYCRLASLLLLRKKLSRLRKEVPASAASERAQQSASKRRATMSVADRLAAHQEAHRAQAAESDDEAVNTNEAMLQLHDVLEVGSSDDEQPGPSSRPAKRQRKNWRAEQQRLGISVGPSEDLEASFSTFLHYLLLCCLDASLAEQVRSEAHNPAVALLHRAVVRIQNKLTEKMVWCVQSMAWNKATPALVWGLEHLPHYACHHMDDMEKAELGVDCEACHRMQAKASQAVTLKGTPYDADWLVKFIPPSTAVPQAGLQEHIDSVAESSRQEQALTAAGSDISQEALIAAVLDQTDVVGEQWAKFSGLMDLADQWMNMAAARQPDDDNTHSRNSDWKHLGGHLIVKVSQLCDYSDSDDDESPAANLLTTSRSVRQQSSERSGSVRNSMQLGASPAVDRRRLHRGRQTDIRTLLQAKR
ncbi:hypothetical protein WJX73_008643 [Symbiochloris irregularis]|uniref:DUF4211 domain-containing protein n=1 Tax=Symbiochloris irregularis TaxID=706552 RepID=A0AAW1PN31_9CHLO